MIELTKPPEPMPPMCWFPTAPRSVSCRMGALEDTERAESRDIGLRAMIGQKQAFVSGSAVDAETLKQLAQRAVDMAQATPEDRYCNFAPERAEHRYSGA